ncbi:MAG TPA: tetratricopeptide repeat protein [Opitutaceae bacterium]|nr:tetratricopeptide repeat protein [Opitutaceae bacterium]
MAHLPSNSPAATVIPAPSEPAEFPALTLRQRLLGTLVLALPVLFIYGPAFHGAWLWDDAYEIAANPILRDSSALPAIWRGVGAYDYYPLKTTIEWVLWRCWVNQPLAWHLANVALQILSAMLLWQLLRKLRLPCAWFGALVFAVHPLAIESVAWIAEFKSTVSMPFALLAFGAYVDYEATGRPAAWVRAFGWFVAAVLCKSAVIMLPVAFAVYGWWRHPRGSLRRRALALAPFFAAAFALGLVTIAFQHGRAIGAQGVPVGDWPTRIARAGLALAFYGGKLLWPLNLMPIYPRWPVAPPAWWMFLPWVGLAVGTLVLARTQQSWSRGLLAGGAMAAALLLPILGFVAMPYMEIGWVADHYAYPALPVFAALASGAAGLLWNRISPHRHGLLAWAAAIGLGLWVAYGQSYARIFRGPQAFWTYAYVQNPHSPMTENGVGKAYLSAGEPAEAIVHFRAALALDPGQINARTNLGLALQQLGRRDEAIRELRKAVHLAPDYTPSLIALGGVLFEAGDTDEARALFERAARIQPTLATADNDLGAVLARTGDLAGAAREFAAALKLDPTLTTARDNLERLQRAKSVVAH